MINIIGIQYLEANIENDEYSYPKAYKQNGIEFNAINYNNRKYEKLDIRFVKNDVSVLIETKVNYNKEKNAKKQLSAYVNYEKNLTGNKIIAILANTENDKVKVWKENISPESLLENEKSLVSNISIINIHSNETHSVFIVVSMIFFYHLIFLVNFKYYYLHII